MANRDLSPLGDFEKDKLEALREPEGFQPNAARARAQLENRLAPPHRSAGKRLAWGGAAAVAFLSFHAMLLPPQASATMNESPSISMHGALMHVHQFLYMHWEFLMGKMYGFEAPDFSLTDATGKAIQLSDYKGKVVLLNFWATWCAPCKEEMPGFMELQKQFGGDLVVLGVAVDEEGWSKVRPYIEQSKVSYPVMVSSPDLPKQYQKIETVPTTFLISREGRISRIQNTLASKAMYEEWVRDLVGARLVGR